MHRSHLRRSVHSGSSDIIDLLTTRQYLTPHQSLREVLTVAMNDLGCCAEAVRSAVAWLDVDVDRPIGRLRRSELLQLGQSIARFWSQAPASRA